MKVLITGFGPFPGVVDNPSGRLARALDGAIGPGWEIVGLEIPTSYARAPALTVQAARLHCVDVVLGSGVATMRERPMLEWFGRADLRPTPDAEGAIAQRLPGPAVVPATLDVPRWADALGCGLSYDAGGYVCNAWLHQVTQALAPVPVGFLHIPAGGLDPERVRSALEKLTAGDAPGPTRTPPLG